MATSRRFGVLTGAALTLLALAAGDGRGQGFYSYYPRPGVVPGHHFYQSPGYVSVPPLFATTSGYGSYYRGPGFISGIPDSASAPGLREASLSTPSPFGAVSPAVYGGYDFSPFALSSAYAFDFYKVSSFGIGRDVPLDTFVPSYGLPLSDYRPGFIPLGYYLTPLLY